MAEDIAFKIQLGIILPKLKEKVAAEMSEIIEELVGIVQAGTLDEDQVSLDAVKEIIMKDIEIFLDSAIFPEIEQRLYPPQESGAEEGVGAGEEEGAEESA